MLVKSRIFGEAEIDEEKIITIPNGLMGFEEFTRFALIYDSEKESKKQIMWFQSIDEASLAFPVMDPTKILGSYSPIVEDEWLAPIGEFKDDSELFILTVLTVPADIKKMTANLKAPLIINTTTRKGCQIIVNNDEYDVRFAVYDYLEKMKKEAQ